MKATLVLNIFVSFIMFGCTQVNRNDVLFEYDNNTRQLNIKLMASALYLTKIDTKTNHDTLEIYVYEKPVFLTFKESKKKASRTIVIDKSIHYISHRDNIYAISGLPNPK